MKIFGTGMQRTGTTSLNRALTALGYRTFDAPRQLIYGLNHPLLEEYDAFTDNPIPLFYREMDQRFPGSKFVHTERDEESWLKSVEWLFTIGAVKFKWHKHPEFEDVHQAIYGRTDFDRDTFLARYRQHNREVKEYFAGRPDDFLELRVLAGEGYEKLCPFLGVPTPSQPFPHWNRQEGLWKVLARHFVRWVRD